MSISPARDPGAELAQFVDDMIIQHDYPGFEPRAFKIGLPEHIVQSPSRLFGDALGNESIYVRIAALRWFQEKTGAIKPYIKAISGLTAHEDPWVRFEASQALERYHHPTVEIATTIAALLKDSEAFVRRGAAKGLAKVLPKLKENRVKDEELEGVVAALKEALADSDGQVRQKAEKALRRGGTFAG
ncbi:MAG: HEAT repeat domain-containing protein [Cyanobacteria bacterium SZAS LIN-3]|nr:HEAT repeat domain-containing protein [Cyanobacteria bacterium SZAS LIN-3]MBS2007876.1 HEAT repeat domain-containing protein [Cyanobacteria bacterium SZAS TMP-1]